MAGASQEAGTTMTATKSSSISIGKSKLVFIHVNKLAAFVDAGLAEE